jgi:hypothetical protein
MAAILAKDEAGWGSSKTQPDSCFQRSCHAHKKSLPNIPKIRRSLPKVGESMKVAKKAAYWL